MSTTVRNEPTSAEVLLREEAHRLRTLLSECWSRELEAHRRVPITAPRGGPSRVAYDDAKLAAQLATRKSEEILARGLQTIELLHKLERAA